MTAANRKLSLSLVLAHEGGYSNHPADPGGATNKGITQRVYDGYRKSRGLPLRSVKLIEPNELEDIYDRQYWRLVRGDDLPAGLDYAVFDFAVNSGPGRAIKFLQSAAGLVGQDIDGVFGYQTLTAVNEAAKLNEEAIIAKLCAARLAWLQTLPTFSTFGTGWTRRVIGMKAGAQPGLDSGVIDYATKLAQEDRAFLMPYAIGVVDGEINGKANGPTPYDEAVTSGWGK